MPAKERVFFLRASVLICVNQLAGRTRKLGVLIAVMASGSATISIVPPPRLPAFSSSAAAIDIAQMKAKLAEVGSKSKAAAGTEQQVGWKSELEFPTPTPINEAHYTDLIVVEKGKSGIICRTLCHACLFQFGRPF